MAFRTNKTPVLQEKSASGAVATFNTALAMPLASCKIAVNAWQEGTGDPSPVNVRNIIPYDTLNIYQRGVNLWDEEWELGAYSNQTGEKGNSNLHIRCKNLIPIKGGLQYYIRFNSPALVVLSYDANGEFIGVQKSMSASGIISPSNRVSFFTFYLNGTEYNNDISINYPSSDTSYHTYAGNIYTIQLGQEVYGAEVDVVNGVMRVTHKKISSSNVSWGWSVRPYTTRSDADASITEEYPTGKRPTMSNKYTFSTQASAEGPDKCLYWGGLTNNKNIIVKRLGYDESLEAWMNYLSDPNNAFDIVYAITPFDIQLTPQQIETLIGNNTIFCDTGDIDLTYKDLDIAKRGNFREVFKLPS